MGSSATVKVRGIDGTAIDGVTADQLTLRNSIYGVIIRDNHILLVPQWDGWDFPGGGMDLGETLAGALTREVFEETGLTVTPDVSHPLHVAEDFFQHPIRKTNYQCLLLYYPCTNATGTISDTHLAADEQIYAKAAQWVPLDKVDTLKFYNPVDSVAIIRKAQQQYG